MINTNQYKTINKKVYKIIRSKVAFDDLPKPKNQHPYFSDYFRQCRPQTLNQLTRTFDYVGKFQNINRQNNSQVSKITNRRKRKIFSNKVQTQQKEFPYNDEKLQDGKIQQDNLSKVLNRHKIYQKCWQNKQLKNMLQRYHNQQKYKLAKIYKRQFKKSIIDQTSFFIDDSIKVIGINRRINR